MKMQDREDVEQEIKLKILEKFEVLQNVAAPTFSNFLKKLNGILIIEHVVPL
ncbi:hypothetical protein AAHB94_31305 [Bacillus toyonensis]